MVMLCGDIVGGAAAAGHTTVSAAGRLKGSAESIYFNTARQIGFEKADALLQL